MLVEIEHVRQVPDEGPRRWFVDENMDLIVWYDEKKELIEGFQLCYDKTTVQRCLTWQKGEGGGRSLLSADGRYSGKRVLRLFDAAGSGLPEEVRDFVMNNLSEKIGS